MRKNNTYHYHDNWSGARKEFKKLSEAMKSAAKETGGAITIFNGTEIKKIVEASGHCPA